MGRFDIPGVISRFGGIKNIFHETEAALSGFSSVFAKCVKEFKDWEWTEKEARLIAQHSVRIITYEDPAYPGLLKQTYDPPCVLYAKGRDMDGKLPAVAIVGTRHPTHYGLKMAETIGRELGAMGVTVVSGMARGCDMAAHKGALSAGGMTVAVLGTGVDIAYPKENKKIYDQISEEGLLLSEFPMSAPPQPQNFPQRNRIISGLSSGVLVVEAPLRSGSLMTARLALDYNREVFAIPGQVTSYQSIGTNKLLKEGAILVENAGDILKALSLVYVPAEDKEEKKEPIPNLGAEEMLIWNSMEDEPVHIDRIMEKTSLSVTRASALLLDMEIKGIIKQVPGKCFLRSF